MADMAGGLVGGATNAIAGGILSKKNAWLNYNYNERAAQNADTRQRLLYTDFLSPQARIRQLKEAGLSPSIFADGAGGGTMGMTQGAQGEGASGVGMPTGIFPSMDIAQMQVQEAQARLLNAEADKLEGKNAEGEANIKKLNSEAEANLAEAGYKKAASALAEANKIGQEIDNYISETTKNFRINYIDEQAKEMKSKADFAYWQAAREEQAWQWQNEIWEIEKNEIIARTQKFIDEAYYAKTGAKLNEELKKHYNEVVQAAVDNAAAHKETAEAYGKYVDQIPEIVKEQLETAERGQNMNLVGDIVGGVTNLIGGGLFGVGSKILGKMMPSTTTKEVQKFDRGHAHTESVTTTTTK